MREYDGCWLYILRCADGSYYTGTTRTEPAVRVEEHNAGIYPGYTRKRRPVTLVHAGHFQAITDVIAAERQVKGWSRAKKEALVRGDWTALTLLAKRVAKPSR